MWQGYLVAAIVGWCGTGWPLRFPRPSGGGGIEPGDIGPPGCIWCNGIVGAISAVILVAVLGSTFESTGLFGLATLSFFGGSFGASVVAGARNLMKG